MSSDAATSHLRPAPAPSAPSSTPRSLFSFYNYITYPWIVLVGIPSTIQTIISYAISPRPFASWSLRAALSTRWAQILRGGPVSQILPPLPTVEEESTPFASPWATITAEEGSTVAIKVISVDPLPEEYRQRGISACPGVESEARPGFWLTPPGSSGREDEKAREGERVILHLHGGGYIRGHPLWLDAPHSIALTLRQRLFSMNYRKCLSSSTAFPAPLIDALAGYIYLTQHLSFPPESITLIGESAGAHLALILSRHLSDLSLPQPGSIILISPWADFTMNPSDLRGTYRSYSKFDFLAPPRLHLGIRSAVRHYTSAAVRGPYFSPAQAGPGDWAYLKEEGVRVLVAYGSKELFEDEDKAVVAGMKRDGVDVEAYVDEDGFHTRVSVEAKANKAFRAALLRWSKQQ